MQLCYKQSTETVAIQIRNKWYDVAYFITNHII